MHKHVAMNVNIDVYNHKEITNGNNPKITLEPIKLDSSLEGRL